MNPSEACRQKTAPLRRYLALAAICLLASACGGGSGSDASSALPIQADIKVLMMGNSHTVGSDLPARLGAMLRAGYPGKTVAIVVAPGSMFLEEHVKNASTLALLKGQSWSHVILQAQKYSSSGLFTYSIAEAVTLVGMARQANALPVLYPEWPRRGIAETDRIFDLHVSIAQQAPACIAPIGQAWDIALQRNPALPLYADDGNHSAAAGAQLTALVLYATLSGKSPAALPDMAFTDVSPAMQLQLRQAAEDAAAAFSPRQYCPQDRLASFLR